MGILYLEFVIEWSVVTLVDVRSPSFRLLLSGPRDESSVDPAFGCGGGRARRRQDAYCETPRQVVHRRRVGGHVTRAHTHRLRRVRGARRMSGRPWVECLHESIPCPWSHRHTGVGRGPTEWVPSSGAFSVEVSGEKE